MTSWSVPAGIAAAIALLAPGPASAQPSFDCGMATTPVERVLCRNDKLGEADRELASSYGALMERLSGPAREHLIKDQVRWVDDRAKACVGEVAAVTRCLTLRYAQRLTTLKAAGEGGYPFVSEHDLVKHGRVKAAFYEVDARYPQFDAPDVDFSAVNKSFVDRVQERAEKAMPPPDINTEHSQIWTYEQGFELHRPGMHSVTVATSFYSFTGGAHGASGTVATVVCLKSGHRVMLADVFQPASGWERILSGIARDDLERQFIERPGLPDALAPANFDKLMQDPDRYVFKAFALELVFNQYEVGPYAAGTYRVVIPYARLTGLLKPDGPVGR